MVSTKTGHAWQIARRIVPGLETLFDDAAQLTKEQAKQAQSRRFRNMVREYEEVSAQIVAEGRRHAKPLPCIGSDGRLVPGRLADRARVDRSQITRLLNGERSVSFATAERIVAVIAEECDLFDMTDDRAARWLSSGDVEGPRWDDYRWSPNPGREAVIADLAHLAGSTRLDATLRNCLRLGLPHPDVEWPEIARLQTGEWAPKGNATWYDKLRKPLSEPIAKPWPMDVPVVTWWDAVAVSVRG